METKLTEREVKRLKPGAAKYDVNDTELRGLCVRVQPSGAMTYFVRYTVAGRKRRWFKLGDARALTVEQARTLARKVLADVAAGTDPQEKKRAARAHTLQSFIEQEFEPWFLAKRKSGPGTVSRLKSSFSKLLDKRLANITVWDVEKLRAGWVKETGVKNTGDRDVACLKSMFSYAVEWGHLIENPLNKHGDHKGVKLVKVDAVSKIRTLTGEEETRLWAALDAREESVRANRASHNAWCRERQLPEWPDAVRFADYLKPMLTILLHTGARRGEAFSLQWADIDFDKRTLTVRGETAKSGLTRVIPLNAVALDTLTSWRAQSPDPLVFPSPVTGGRFNNIDRAWKAILRTAGIKGLRLHDLRHTFASRCLAAGADINVVKELLGHANIATTAIYLHSRDEDKAAAVDRLVPQSNVIGFEKTARMAQGARSK